MVIQSGHKEQCSFNEKLTYYQTEMNSSKNFIGLGLVVIVNLAVQFLFQWFIITSLGPGNQTDALFGAMALPQFILLVLCGSLTMVVLPIIAKYTGNKFLEASWNYFHVIGLLFVGIAVLLLITANWWVALILPGLKGLNFHLALNLSRIQVIAMVFSALFSVVWTINTAKGNFFRIEFTSIATNLIAFIVLIIFIHSLGIYMVAWVSVLRVILQLLFLMMIMGPYRRPDFNSPFFKITWKKLKPLVIGNAYFQADPLVDRHLTSRGITGELTLLNFAQQLYQAVNSILLKVLVNTMIPEMAKAYAAGDIKRFDHILRKRLFISFAFLTTGYIAMLGMGEWLLGLIFSFKKMTPGDVHQLWWLLVLLGGYLLGDIIGNVTSGAFFAKGDTATPTKIGMILFTIYIPVKVFCYFKFGIAGLAIAASTYQVISFSTKLFFLRKHLF